MKYLGLDVHSSATVWCLLDDSGETVERGKVATTAPALTSLVERLSEDGDLLAAQEIGTMSYFVHDVLTEAGVKLLSFNAQQLRMIASSRKKTDKRDAYWLAKGVASGMMPHPVYLPSGKVRRLRQLLAQRAALRSDLTRWLLRAKTCIRATGCPVPRTRKVAAMREALLERPEGLDQHLSDVLERCQRVHETLSDELRTLEKTIVEEASEVEAIGRLQTIPAVGPWVATILYASVGDVSRFSSARKLCSYVGLVPSVWQSAEMKRAGGITKQGNPMLRSALVQAGQVLLTRCRSAEAAPLKALPLRVHTTRKRRNIAVVAAARHILRVAYYLLRDGTTYDPARLAAPPQLAAAE